MVERQSNIVEVSQLTKSWCNTFLNANFMLTVLLLTIGLKLAIASFNPQIKEKLQTVWRLLQNN